MALSKFLRILEQKIDQTDYDNWSRDKMVATPFLTFADIEMSKVVTGLISKDNLDMIELRAQIRGLESTLGIRELESQLNQQGLQDQVDQMDLLQEENGALTARGPLIQLSNVGDNDHTASGEGIYLKKG